MPHSLVPSGHAFVTFLAASALWLLTFFYCRQIYWRDPHSAFFDSTHVYERDYSARRQSAGLKFLDSVALTNTPSLRANDTTPEICAAYVTVRRDMEGKNGGRQYIDGALGSMLEGLNDEERDRMHVYILFADVDPEIHPLWNEDWLPMIADEWGRYDVGEEKRVWLAKLMEEKEWQIKGVFDYTYALKHCYNTGAKYISIYEDDIIFSHDWYTQTTQALDTISSASREPGEAFYYWIYLRLFYTETFLAWSQDDFWYRHIYAFFLLAVTITSSILLLVKRSIQKSRHYLDTWTILVLGLVVVPAFLALGFMVGKYNLWWWKLDGVVKMNKWGCCTQAMVFPRERVLELANWLDERGHGQTDLMIEDFAEENGLERLALGKQVVQHVGLKSSRGSGQLNAMSTWAFHFEEYDSI